MAGFRWIPDAGKLLCDFDVPAHPAFSFHQALLQLQRSQGKKLARGVGYDFLVSLRLRVAHLCFPCAASGISIACSALHCVHLFWNLSAPYDFGRQTRLEGYAVDAADRSGIYFGHRVLGMAAQGFVSLFDLVSFLCANCFLVAADPCACFPAQGKDPGKGQAVEGRAVDVQNAATLRESVLPRLYCADAMVRYGDLSFQYGFVQTSDNFSYICACMLFLGDRLLFTDTQKNYSKR